MITILLKLKKLNRFSSSLKVAKALIMHTSYADGNHFSEEDKLYELADEFLGGFYEENGIEQLYDIDDAEY